LLCRKEGLREKEREIGRNFPSIKRGLRGVFLLFATCLLADRKGAREGV
jgi:hypothetical protein